jgi:hypothetical protein
MEGKTNATTLGWRFAGLSNGKRTMDNAFISEHMLEETRDSF